MDRLWILILHSISETPSGASVKSGRCWLVSHCRSRVRKEPYSAIASKLFRRDDSGEVSFGLSDELDSESGKNESTVREKLAARFGGSKTDE